MQGFLTGEQPAPTFMAQELSNYAMWYFFHLEENHTCLKLQYGGNDHTLLSCKPAGERFPATQADARGVQVIKLGRSMFDRELYALVK